MSKIIFLLILIFLTFTPKVFAHDTSLTYTTITLLDKKIDVTMTTPYNNIQTIYPDKNKDINTIDLSFFSEAFSKGFIITNDAKQCVPKLRSSQKITDIKEVRYHFTFLCKKPL